ncbi:MAG: LCP family protein [Spirochaetales bacterium]|nr:LCP family protein [Spirochaetales bacterium]
MNKKRILIGGGALLVLILLLTCFFVLNNRIVNLTEEVILRNSTLSDELSVNSVNYDLMKQNLMLLNQDSNELRDLMKLSERQYPELDKANNPESESGESEVDYNILFFKAVDRILLNKQNEEKMILFGRFIRNEAFVSLLGDRNLKVDINASGLDAGISGKEGVDFTLHYNDENDFSIQSVLGRTEEVSSTGSIIRFIDANRTVIDEQRRVWLEAAKSLRDLDEDKGIVNLVESRVAEWSAVSENSSTISRSLSTNNGSLLASINFVKRENHWVLSGGISPDGQNFDYGDKGYSDLLKGLIPIIEAYDPREPGDIAEEVSRNRVMNLRQDTGFKAYLAKTGSSLGEKFREDHYYFYLDILSSEATVTGSIAVQKHTGEIYLMDQDDVVITSLKTLGRSEGMVIQRTLSIPEDYLGLSPIVFGEDDIAFVLIGANEANTDTMMVVHLNELTGKGTIVTIPRDLYYKGRKINSIYPTFGPSELLKTLSDITGLPVKRYMFIDMFAFADVVDILGGIDIVLDEPLIDPSYRIKENGQWSTLHYEAGPLHLGGVESLRVARSRHSSSDFGRAERQQMILMALKNRMGELNATDAGKLVELANSLMSYVRTDFSVIELLNLFSRYRSAPFSQHVLSWDNVLYNTYSNLYLLEEGTEVDENFNRGAWILLPVNNDWEVIKWFIRKVISEDGNE